MSICSLSARATTKLGSATAVAGLLLFQLDGLKAVALSPMAGPLHFVQGLCLGCGLAMMIGGLIRRRAEG